MLTLTHIVVAALPLECAVSGHPVRIEAEWEDPTHPYPIGPVVAHFTGRSGRSIEHRVGDACRNPESVVVTLARDSVSQRLAAALLAQSLARPHDPRPRGGTGLGMR
ncbi:MAG TPA: hypothetical protein VK163_08610 [Opitutaceae bacterium]|nr:hypothetical protein [Opitutaceae bacterium]